jgi:putative transposase
LPIILKNLKVAIMKTEYRSTFLPHLLPLGSTFFVTFNLFDSIPMPVMMALKEQHEQRKQVILLSDKPDKGVLLYRESRVYFVQFEEALDKLYNGIKHLENNDLAQLVVDKIFEFDGDWYDTLAICIMPNHVHMVLDFSIQIKENTPINDETYVQLDAVMKRIKGATGLQCNRVLQRSGVAFWQRESFDHYVRNEAELHRIIRYVAQNPVKAGLVKEWTDWKFTYISPKYAQFAEPIKPPNA